MQPHHLGRTESSGRFRSAHGVGYFFPPICMDTTAKKKKDVPSAPAERKPLAAPVASNGPVKVLRIDDVSASIFARERQYNGKPTAFYSVSFSRSYKDPRGERKFTKSFDTDDLGKIVELSQRASETIRNLQDPAALPNL